MSWAYYILLVIAAGVYRALPKRLRGGWLVMVSVGMLGVERPASAGVALALILFTTVVCRTLSSERPSGRARTLLFWGAIAAVVSVMVWVKLSRHPIGGEQWSLLDFWRRDALALVGISYLGLRLIHALILAARRSLPPTSAWSMIVFGMWPTAYFAGPIQRLPGFSEQLASDDPPDSRTIEDGLWRCMVGLFKIICIGGALNRFLVRDILTAGAPAPTWVFWGAIYGFAFFLYFNFAGYTDVAIGLGKLFGVTLPENFAYPFLKKLPVVLG